MSDKTKIILINGTSSAGKSSLAKAIQSLARDPYQIVSLDEYRDGMPDRFRGLNSESDEPGANGLNVVAKSVNGSRLTHIEFGLYGETVLRGMKLAVVQLAKLGINVIVDDMVTYREAAHDYASLFQPFHTIVIGVHCDIDVLKRREQQREGRFPGTAEMQLSVVHRWMQYDLNIDTTYRSSLGGAIEALSTLTTSRQSRAIDRMFKNYKLSHPVSD